jgi:hypothetical protein
MGDNNQEQGERGSNQYYGQHDQQNQHVFHQTQQYSSQNPNMYENYSGENQYYGQQPNYNQQYAQHNQQQYYDYPTDDYEQDDFDNLAEIEREINRASGLNNFGEVANDEDDIINEFEKDIEARSVPKSTSKSFLPAGAMPTSANGSLSAHAKEFWFPECRNCECCKGFKHGCECCKGGIDTCTAASCVDDAFKQQVTNDLASRPTVVATSSASGAYKVESPKGEPSPRHQSSVPAASGGEICKFESYPGGCRFGSSCRFKHSTPSVAPGGYTAPAVGSSGAGGKSQCMYFARGNCQYGDSCRFAHN